MKTLHTNTPVPPGTTARTSLITHFLLTPP